MCLNDCTGGQELNLAGNACIDMCPSGSMPMNNEDGVSQCVCDDLLNPAEDGCLAAC